MSYKPVTCTRPALALLCWLAAPAGAYAQDDDGSPDDDIPHITVVGTAAAQVAPDVAEVRLSVAAQKPTAAEAWDADSTLTHGVVDAAKAAGIKPQNIGTTHVDLFQVFEEVRQPDGSDKREARGFRATQGLSIRLSELSKIGELTSALIAKGADTFEGVSFSLAQPDALQDRLRGEAMRNARHQAETLANAAGVKLGRLLRVERPDHPTAVQPLLRQRTTGSATMSVEPGTETLSAEVEATYAIEQ